jgi:YYY domain-containing protein
LSLVPENENRDEESVSAASNEPLTPVSDGDFLEMSPVTGDDAEPVYMVEEHAPLQSHPVSSHTVVVEAPPKKRPRRSAPNWKRRRTAVLLLGILAVAAFFRFYGTNFDQNTHQHPDERFITQETLGLQWPAAGDTQVLFDVQHSPMNLRRADNEHPGGRHYSYGSFPVYMNKFLGWALDTYGPVHPNNDVHYFEGYDGVTILGRNLGAIFDLITVFLVFLIARRLFSSGTGLIAAALVACSVTNIQIAHFYASDAFLVTFMMAALYFSVVLMQRPSWWAAVGAGLCLGLAVASKVSVVPFALIVLAAVVLRTFYRRRTRALGAELGDPVGMKPASARERQMPFWRHLLGGLGYVAIAAVCAALAFLVTEPYVIWSFDWSLLSTPGGLQAVLGSSPFWGGITEQAAIQGGTADVPYTRQYIGTVPILYHVQQMVFWGLGVAPGLLAVVGFAVALWRAILRKPAEILLMAGALPYLATIRIVETQWMRYWLPLVPIFCIVGAALLVRGHARTRELMVRQPWLAGSKRAAAVLRRNAFAIFTALAVGGAFLWAVAFMNIYAQEHSRNQASDWIYDNVPTTITDNGQERKVRLSGEVWDDSLPLSRPPDPNTGKPFRDQGLYGLAVSYGMYDDHPPADQELEYIKNLVRDTDYFISASNRIYGSIDNEPWRYQVQILFYRLLFQNKLGFEHLCSDGTGNCQHTVQISPALFGINFDDQSADESFTVYDHPAVDVFKKTSNLSDEQWRILFSSALNEPADHFSLDRKATAVNDLSLAYDQPLPTLGELHDYSWNPLGQPETQWIGVVLWLLLAYVLGLLALPVVFLTCRRLPDRGYAFAKLTGLLILAWAIWCVSSAKLLPFTVWTTLLIMVLMAALAYLCWRQGARELIRQFVAEKRGLIYYYEGLFLLTFAAFLVIRMLNPDLWHPSLGGEKTMEFGFLNATLRSPWMPPADPFFAGGYINYYYYGQFVMAVMIKLLGINPALGVNFAIPLLYALTFTIGASIVYNIVAWSQEFRGSKHHVSRSALAFGVLAGVLMLAIGNMHGIYQLIFQKNPELGAQLVNFVNQMHFAGDARIEQSVASPSGGGFDFWGPSRIIHQTINEFPFWSFLFADFHPHLIDMPFTMLLAGLAMNLAFAGPFRRREHAIMPVRLGAGRWLKLHLRDALGWMWGDGWSGALLFAIMAVILGTLFATNSWDWPTFAGICGGSVLLGLLIATARRTDVPEEARASRFDMVFVWLANLLTVGLFFAASLLAASPFLISFKNVLRLGIRALIDGARIEDGSDIMHRTTLAEFIFFWAIFVFVALSYTLVRLWNFPWGAAAGDIARLFSRRASTAVRTPRTESVFSPDAALRLNPAGPQLAMAGAGGAPMAGGISSVAFSHEVRENVEPARERLGESSEAVMEVPAGDGYGHDDSGDVSTYEVEVPIEEPAPIEATHPEVTDREVGPTWLVDQAETAPADTEDTIYRVATTPAAYATPIAAERVARPIEMPGVVPLWAGVGMLAITAVLTGLQVATGQLLLALLIALLGGIIATTLASSRTPSSMFTGLLLVAALAVAMGVELVYLADHLRGGDMFRMNTVFKFYIQVWLLFGVGSAAAIYYILYGVRERPATQESISEIEASAETAPVQGEPNDVPLAEAHEVYSEPAPAESLAYEALPVDSALASEITVPSNGHETTIVTEPATFTDAAPETPAPEPLLAPTTSGPLANWLVWTPEDEDAIIEPPPDDMPAAATAGADTIPLGTAPSPQTLQRATRSRAGISWTFGRVVWTGLFVLLLAASGVFTIFGTQDRVSKRFDQPPPVGTLDGLAFMETAKYGVQGNDNSPGAIIEMRYDREAINWLNQNVAGLHVIAEGPYEYYRDGGMRAASYTGLPMIVGGLHQGEQRYDWLVGTRDGESRQLLSTTDPQIALTLLSKYDVDYIYLGQLEQLRSGDGIEKFDQMAKAGVLKEVFRSRVPEGIKGTIIYQVVRSPKKLVGAPVTGSGVPGLSFTPVPTRTPTPPPTPPVDNPELKALIDAVTAAPNDIEAHQRLVDWYRNNNFWQAAASELDARVRIRPSDIAVRHQLGDAYQQMGQDEKALKAWEDARDVEPNNAAARNKLGIGYRDHHRLDDAIKEFQAAVQADPNFNEAALHLGESYLAKGDRQSAKQAFQDAIDRAKEKDNPWAIEAQKRLNEIK